MVQISHTAHFVLSEVKKEKTLGYFPPSKFDFNLRETQKMELFESPNFSFWAQTFYKISVKRRNFAFYGKVLFSYFNKNLKI